MLSALTYVNALYAKMTEMMQRQILLTSNKIMKSKKLNAWISNISQIPVTTTRFEGRTSGILSSNLTHNATRLRQVYGMQQVHSSNSIVVTGICDPSHLGPDTFVVMRKVFLFVLHICNRKYASKILC